MNENNQTPQVSKPACRFLKATNIKYLLIIFLFLFAVIFTYRFTCMYICSSNSFLKNELSLFKNLNNKFVVKQFTSKEEFKSYLSESSNSTDSFLGNSRLMEYGGGPDVDLSFAPSSITGTLNSKQAVNRTSTTNVQVLGIDEPDIVKADDKYIFTSFPKNPNYIVDYPTEPLPIGLETEPSPKITRDRIYPPIKQPLQNTEIFNAFPPSELENIGNINKIGNLLLADNTLIIFTDKIVYGYDVSNKSNPKEIWQMEYSDNSTYKEARLYKNQIYLIVSTMIKQSNPCPYYPVKIDGEQISIKCTNIYHPTVSIPTELTYTVLKLDPKSGAVKDSVSFLAGYRNSTIYMSENNIYLMYSYENDPIKLISNLFIDVGTNIFPQDIVAKINRLASYDLSNETKIMEFQIILSNYMNGLSENEKLKVENNFKNAIEKYTEKNIREFESTGIIKIAVGDLSISSTGNVPGHPLNQFSIDEYDNDLRIATTSGVSAANILGSNTSVNDVYVLDNKLNISGSVRGLGENERIYSARFIGDRGYVVTFRETDPFYVLDLSNPRNPQKKGELKIPGYSSYLHPINKNIILGIGKEGSEVKLSLFDVSNAADPIEIDKYTLDEYWSEAVNNHRAFLMDAKHNVFFLPGAKGGYIFSYEDNTLNLKTAVSGSSVKRAVYINDSMYIIGEDGITVLNENNWSVINNFSYTN